ncbi:MAG TPA: hypothetical protein VGS10_08415 [Terracidiphilus sp.]|nr:hypothetical protein [Terracidiphilus sp.]
MREAPSRRALPAGLGERYAPTHFVALTVFTVHLYDGGLVAIRIGIYMAAKKFTWIQVI